MEEKKKLCKIKPVEANLEEIKLLVKKPRAICVKCGRVAKKKRNLCYPEKL
jgi:hypothetical protein